MITTKNVEQFDYIPYTLPSLDMLVVANKKEAIKILDEANKYLTDTIGHYARFYNEAVVWKEKNKASIREIDLKNIDENLKNLLNNIIIVAGATVKIIDATSDLSGKTQKTDIKSTTGNGNDNDRDRNVSKIVNTEIDGSTISSIMTGTSIPIDKEAVDKALEDINNAIDAIVVKVPTPTIPSNVNVPKSEEQIAKEQEVKNLNQKVYNSSLLSKVLDEVVTNHKTGIFGISIDKKGVEIAATAIKEYLENTTDENKGMAESERRGILESTINSIAGGNNIGIAIAIARAEEEAYKEELEKSTQKLDSLQKEYEKEYEKEVEKAKIEAQQEAALADLNNLQTAIQQGTGSINNALDAINEAEQKGLISSEEADKQRDAVVEKVATALGVEGEDKESLKNDIKEGSKELNNKIDKINEQLEKGEITPEQAEKDRKEALEKAQEKMDGFIKDTITTSGSWGKDGWKETVNPDGTITRETIDSSGNTINITVDPTTGNGTITTTTTDGMTHTDGMHDWEKDNKTQHTQTDADGSGSNNTTTTGGDNGGPGDKDNPESGGSNTGL